MRDTLALDVRFALRSSGRLPAFTLTAVLTLALGIGANAAMFSFADATAWRPVPAPHQIVRVFTSSKDIPLGEMSYPDYRDLRARTSTLSVLVAYETGSRLVTYLPNAPRVSIRLWR